MTIREGRWLCRYCGLENLGRFESCTGDGHGGCGAARGKDVRFYEARNSPIVTDPDLLEDAKSGPDWHCDHCDGGNKHAYQGKRIRQCVHCGQGRDAPDYTHPVRTFATAPQSDAQTKTTPHTIHGQAGTNTSRPTPRHTKQTQPTKPTKTRGLLGGLGAGALLILTGFLVWFFFFDTKAVSLEVTQVQWERSIAIEEETVLEGQGWTLPRNVLDSSSRERLKETIQEIDYYAEGSRTVTDEVPSGSESYVCGTIDLGNGFFQDRECTRTLYTTVEREETYTYPVYKDVDIYAPWYTYTYLDWPVIDTARAQGDHRITPQWPTLTLQPRQRSGRRQESYTVVVRQDTQTHHFSLPQATWQTLSPGQTVQARQTRVGSLSDIAWDPE